MIKLLSALVFFIREVVFDNKNEYDIRHQKFNTRKFSIFLVVLASIFITIFLLNRLHVISSMYLSAVKAEELCIKNTKVPPSDIKSPTAK